MAPQQGHATGFPAKCSLTCNEFPHSQVIVVDRGVSPIFPRWVPPGASAANPSVEVTPVEEQLQRFSPNSAAASRPKRAAMAAMSSPPARAAAAPPGPRPPPLLPRHHHTKPPPPPRPPPSPPPSPLP